MNDTKLQNTAKKATISIENPAGFYVLVLLSMLYMSIMLCNAILTNKYIGNDSFFILGGTLTSPFVFILDDIVAEIYGYKITCFMIISGFASQTVFVLICQLAVIAPHPIFFTHQSDYAYILGQSLLRIDLSGFFAYIAANLINSYILSRWKVLLKGKKFWLRSLGSSAFSEALYSIIAILLMEMNAIPMSNIMKVIAISFSIKVCYSLVFAGPAQGLVNMIKRVTNIDVYDLPPRFTPFDKKSEGDVL